MNTQTPNILVIRHEPCTTLGLLNAIAQSNNSQIHFLDITQGEELTEPIENYSHILILGGNISAYEDDRYPCLRYEFKLIETALEFKLPVVGICLGAQVLARILGARVYKGEAGREAGWCEISTKDTALTDPLLQGFPAKFRVFQSHQDTFDLPHEAVHLAYSDKYPNQAFCYHEHIWALQFHLEFDETVLSRCSSLIEQELRESNIQDTTVEQLLAEAQRHSPAVAPLASDFMQLFLQQRGAPLVAS